MKKVLLLFGGNSEEHFVSCKSAKAILENIDISKFTITSVGISKDNNWYIFNDKLEFLEDGSWLKYSLNNKVENIIDFIKSFDVVFPIIHGANGEDGKLQGMLDLFNIKYVGCKTMASSIGMDKELSKIVFNSAAIPQIPYLTVYEDYNIDDITSTLELPLIIKPANGGSSIGINKATNKNDLEKSIKEALKYDKKVIVEKFIKGRELECSIIEDNGNLYASSIGEIIPYNDFYDYESKYSLHSKTCIAYDLDDNVIKKIKEYAIKAFKLLGAKSFSRVDFFLVDNNIFLNEINTLPGFTPISMYPKLLINDGYRFKDIITILLENC